METLCREADEKYNSGLFHFRKEKDSSEEPDRITPSLAVDDKVFRPILQSLYFEHGSPYDFRIMPVEILGTVYERFLGKVIHLTGGHRAKVEEKPEVRKAGGVYYTPAYIVNYIVDNTLGRQICGRSPMQLAGLRNGKHPFRVLDMACGSGSFLLGAYQYVLGHCFDWYVENNPNKHKRAVYKDARSGQWRLTIEEKKRILTAHIFGVDIDPQAVEVSKLSLLLKVLEGESDETICQQQQRRLLSDRALPNLADNVKCGNSLIRPDYFAGRLVVDTEDIERLNAFDWHLEFADAMNAGGFDCVIGNPPWGATLAEEDLEYLRARHKRVIARMINSYIYFTDEALRLARDGCPVGYIVPATLLNQVDALPLRDRLLERGIAALINMGQGIFGKKVLNTSCIIVSRKGNKLLTVADLSDLTIDARPGALTSAKRHSYPRWKKLVATDPHHTFFTRRLGDCSCWGVCGASAKCWGV